MSSDDDVTKMRTDEDYHDDHVMIFVETVSIFWCFSKLKCSKAIYKWMGWMGWDWISERTYTKNTYPYGANNKYQVCDDLMVIFVETVSTFWIFECTYTKNLWC